MKPQQTVSDFLSENNMDFRDNISAVFEIYEENRRYICERTCGVCGSELTKEEFNSISSLHFNRTCFAHREYAHHFDLVNIREDLGIKNLDLVTKIMNL